MIDASRRATRATKRGNKCASRGLPNALFVVAAADALTVHFPWGSLLRGLLDADPAIVAGIARVTRPGATVTLLLSVTERDRAIGSVSLDERRFAELAPHYAAHGLLLHEVRRATVEEVTHAHSSWAKRLGAGVSRPVWFVRFHRAGTASCMASTERSIDVVAR
jgi:16S rRNA (adenine(1408)-N(1))-methyltransferase